MNDRACERVRDALSARADGEDPGLTEAYLDAHLARCAACTGFAAAVDQQRRLLRFRPAEAVPDLTERILAAIPPGRAPGPPHSVPAEVAAPKNPPRSARHHRRRSVAAVAAVVAGALAGGSALGWSMTPHPGGPPVSSVSVGGGSPADRRFPGAVVLPTGVTKPDVVFTDTGGRAYDVATATAGHVTLLYFGYTNCPDVCPINLALAAAAIRDLPAADQSRVDTVFVTTDPARDTRPVIRTWLDQFDNRFVGLRGTAAEIQAAETQVDMPLSYPTTEPPGRRAAAETDVVVHAGYTLVYGTDGQAFLQVDPSETVPQLTETLQHLLGGAQG